jgi:uncharacterized membrane protein
MASTRLASSFGPDKRISLAAALSRQVDVSKT